MKRKGLIVTLAGVVLVAGVVSGCAKKTKNEIATTESTTEVATTEKETTEDVTTEDVTTEIETETTEIETTGSTPATIKNPDDMPEELVEGIKDHSKNEIMDWLYTDDVYAISFDEMTGQWDVLKASKDSDDVNVFATINPVVIRDMGNVDAMVLEDETQIVVNLYPSFGSDATSYIFDEGGNIISQIGATVYQYEGEIVVQQSGYNSCYDTETNMYMGRTWTSSFLEYDKENKTYKEYAAKEISKDDFLNYKGADDALDEIEAKYEEGSLKMKFYQRNNGYVYVECAVQNGKLIIYEHYAFKYDDENTFVGKYGCIEGLVATKITSFDEV